MPQGNYIHVQRLFNSLYSYYKIPLQLKKGRNLLIETRNIPAGFIYSRSSENSLFTVNAGNIRITVSSAGEAFADLQLEDRLTIVSCKCQLIDIAPLRRNADDKKAVVPLCTTNEFVTMCTLLHNYFAENIADELAAYLSANIHMIFNSPNFHIYHGENSAEHKFEELSSPENMFQYDSLKLNLIRRGDVKGLIKMLESEKYNQINKNYFKSVFLINNAIEYFLPILVRLAGESGADVRKAWALYRMYATEKMYITNIDSGLDTYNRMLVDFCQHINNGLIGNYSAKIQAVCLYLSKNWNNKIDIEYMCKIFDISKAYLMKQFKKETGYTVIEYVTNIRMNYINHMLIYSNEPMSHIAAEAGYSSQSYMTAVYKSKFGITPLEYKKKHFSSTLSQSSDIISSAQKEI